MSQIESDADVLLCPRCATDSLPVEYADLVARLAPELDADAPAFECRDCGLRWGRWI